MFSNISICNFTLRTQLRHNLHHKYHCYVTASFTLYSMYTYSSLSFIFLPAPAKITETIPSKNVTAYVGGELTLECFVEGNPSPTVTLDRTHTPLGMTYLNLSQNHKIFFRFFAQTRWFHTIFLSRLRTRIVNGHCTKEFRCL